MNAKNITPSQIVMIRPHHFMSNPDTMADNAFQVAAQSQQLSQLAYQQVSAAADALSAAGVTVHLFEDTGTSTPDSVFPNNWFSTHCSGELVTYPMYVPNRRLEVRSDITDFIKAQYQVSRQLDLTSEANAERFLEGTGSMVIDQQAGIAYAVASKRTDATLFRQLCDELGYQPILFDASDNNGQPVYHTNVLMCLAEHFVLIGLDMVPKAQHRLLLDRFAATNKAVVTLSATQISQFCGNAIELKGKEGNLLALSATAYNALTPAQITLIEQCAQLLPIDVSSIESAGGSLRCMIAGIHLNLR
jgi:hypothetical protein